MHESLEGLVLTPQLIKNLVEADVDGISLTCLLNDTEHFMDNIKHLDSKMTWIQIHRGDGVTALREMEPELEKLRLKATERIREFLLQKIESLKIPNTNIAIIQQNVFLKYRELYWFLVKRYSEIASEIRLNYVTTVALYYTASFERYIKIITKLQSIIADKYDLIGSEESVRRGGFFQSSRSLKDRSSVFTLNKRAYVLDENESGIILGLGDIPVKHPYEAIFKSLHSLLLDNGSSEFCFCR